LKKNKKKRIDITKIQNRENIIMDRQMGEGGREKLTPLRGETYPTEITIL